MIAFLAILAAACGAAMIPQVADRLSTLTKRPTRGIQRLAQSGLLGLLLLISLFAKAFPFSILLALVWLGMVGTNFLRDRMIGDDLQDRAAGGTRAPPPASRSKMSRAEALSVLGLEEGATVSDVNAAYKKLISQIHPDKGGTDYLAAKINEAREVLKS